MPKPGGPLRVRCLGSLRLEDSAGADVTPRTRRARAVLAYLAMSGRAASRERLADLLWSDRAAVQARGSVRQALFELRHLGDGVGLIESTGHDEVCLDVARVTTDLSQIRIAAQAGDWDRLQELLSASDPGLLTDLDGLDTEYDAWLQVQRADEPARTLSAALAAAERCFAEAGPRSAQGIVAEVQRLDPGCEEAVRLAMRIDHGLGDRGALHRHFDLFRERLKEDYAAEPSDETLELFRRLTSPSGPFGQQRAVRDGKDGPGPAPATVGGISKRSRLALLAFALLALIGFAIWQLRPPADAAEPPLIAVLPFEHQQFGDRFLAEGLWEDTRLALSQNQGLRVLGRTTTVEMAKADRGTTAYRDLLDVDYILEATVRRHGDRVRVTAGLIQTSDGVSIWNSTLNGRLGDVLALQAAVAEGIEGRLRGQLARGGGKLPEQIATSPEVYALYSEARSLLRERQPGSAQQAAPILNRALQVDPNFAPAWSMLAAASYFGHFGVGASAEWRAEAQGHVRRALALAPRLAEAHAVHALIEGLGSPASERSLERAVALDANNSEAWNWLGIARDKMGNVEGARRAYQRSVEIDPFLPPALDNLTTTLLIQTDHAEFDRLLRRLSRAGTSDTLIPALEAKRLFHRGDYSRAMKRLLNLRRPPGEADRFGKWMIGEGLMRLGYFVQAREFLNLPSELDSVLRGEGISRQFEKRRIADAHEFWGSVDNAALLSRVMINRGRSGTLVDSYRSGFDSRRDFLGLVAERGESVIVIPNLAVALQRSGQAAEANTLLKSIEEQPEMRMERVPGDREPLWELARIRAAQARPDEAINLMSRAVAQGWLPDGWLHPLDIGDDPPFRGLRGDPRFRRLRMRILAHIARERAELGPIKP